MLNRFRFPLSVAAFLIVLLDIAMAFGVYRHGRDYLYWNADLNSDSGGNLAVGVVPITPADWLIIAGAIGFHLILAYFLWSSWSSARRQTGEPRQLRD